MARNTTTETTSNRPRRITTAAIILAVAAVLPTTGAAASPAMTPEEKQAVNAAQQMFVEAGFEFPDVDIEFHDDKAACRGMDGWYEKVGERTATVDVCYQRSGPDVDHIGRARMLWHELGHAYLEPRLDGATKAALLELVGLEAWSGGAWTERGGEYATEILIWGIRDGRYRTNTRLQELDDATLAAGFTLLTGLEAPSTQ